MTKLVDHRHIWNFSVEWGARLESAEALAMRWIALIQRLQTVDPLLANWMHYEKARGMVSFDPRLEVQVARVRDRTEKNSNGELVPRAGTFLWLMNDPLPRSKHFDLSARLGQDYTSNQLYGGTSHYAVPDPALVTFGLLRGVLLAAAETFEARQGRVYTSDLRRFWKDSRGISNELELAWMSYIAPSFAHLVTPPASVVVEHRPDGGLLMAATEETFSTENADHLVAARAIKAALEPYNAVPWPPERGFRREAPNR